MSLNRENVAWQSADGTWSLGFYEFYYVNQDSDNFDEEWDVEYGDDFDRVSTGHPTVEAAHAAHHGANPGGSTEVEFTPANAESVAAYDALAAKVKATGRFDRGWWCA